MWDSRPRLSYIRLSHPLISQGKSLDFRRGLVPNISDEIAAIIIQRTIFSSFFFNALISLIILVIGSSMSSRQE